MTVTSDYEYFDHIVDEMDVVFENGEIKRTQTFEEIRTIANSFIKTH